MGAVFAFHKDRGDIICSGFVFKDDIFIRFKQRGIVPVDEGGEPAHGLGGGTGEGVFPCSRKRSQL